MSAAENTQRVKESYAAFQRGDIASILATLDDNIEWQGVIGTEGVLPQAGVRKGKAAVQEFFKHVAETTDFKSFEPLEFIAEGDQVAVVGRYTARVKPTGKNVESGWVMLFTFKNGKVVKFREYTDSAQLVKAFQI